MRIITLALFRGIPFYLVDGNWGKWSSWNDCTKSCGGGNQTRKRECNDPKPAYGGKACGDYSEESRTCNTRECPSKDCTINFFFQIVM